MMPLGKSQLIFGVLIAGAFVVAIYTERTAVLYPVLVYTGTAALLIYGFVFAYAWVNVKKLEAERYPSLPRVVLAFLVLVIGAYVPFYLVRHVLRIEFVNYMLAGVGALTWIFVALGLWGWVDRRRTPPE